MYERTRERISSCDCLVIDEIGMISAKLFSEVEFICRSIRQNTLTFGGIQVIACGSFFQLPPVPSSCGKGQFAFESKCFQTVFLHRIILNAVHIQKELDFVRAINKLCEGYPTPRTHQLLLSLKRPIDPNLNPLDIFGTNYDVDFFNFMKLNELQGPEQLYMSEDTGEKINYKKCGANKYLLLKENCKVIVTRNLYDELVNGISGQVISMSDNSVNIWVDRDIHLNHAFQGREFEISRYTFIHHDEYNNVIAVRKQLPIKLGYAVTVDKSQGRTLDAVVVDTTNFWRLGQLGVAVGRATSKKSCNFQVTTNRLLCFNIHIWLQISISKEVF